MEYLNSKWLSYEQPATVMGQIILKFENGYGASILNTDYSYGIELGIIRFNGDSWTLEGILETNIDSEEQMSNLLESIQSEETVNE